MKRQKRLIKWLTLLDFEARSFMAVVVHKVHGWNQRKSLMKPAHILAAWNRLKEQNWLENKAPAI
jgi:hypothetical protein